MTESIDHKRGDTFSVSVTVTEDDLVTPIDMAGWTVDCQLRTAAGALIEDLVVTETDYSSGEFTLSCDDTTEWPELALRSDIQYTDLSGTIISTETFII